MRKMLARTFPLALLTLLGLALAQQPQPGGTRLLLPDGTRCVPAAAGSNQQVDGAHLDYLCGDAGNVGLVGGLLPTGGRIMAELVRFDAAPELTPAPTPEQTEPTEPTRQELLLFDVQRLVLANGINCRPAEEPGRLFDGRRVTYVCDDVSGDDTGRLVLLGGLTQADGTLSATKARVNADGSEFLDEEVVTITLLDASLPLARHEWTLASFGTGEDPPLEGHAPTLVFLSGQIAGSAGCNRYFARATLSGESGLALGPAGSTLMACPEEQMALEQRFLQALAGVSDFEAIDGRLYLHGSGETLTFEPATGPGATGGK